MMKLLAVAAALLVATNAISITWTGYGGDNQWTNIVNWSPDQVPTTNDDVTISCGVVQVTIPTGVNSLVMGTCFNAPANVTFFQSFFIGSGGMQVQGNGNVFINSGAAQLSGTVTIGGALYFQSGQLSGSWTVTSRGVVDLSGSFQKVFAGCQFTSQASSFVASGVLALNQSSQVVVLSTVVFSGDVSIQAQDTTPVLLDTSAGTATYTGGGDLQIQAPWNVGTFNFESGTVTIYNTVSASCTYFQVSTGAQLSLVGSGTLTFPSETTIQNEGAILWYSTAAWTLHNSFLSGSGKATLSGAWGGKNVTIQQGEMTLASKRASLSASPGSIVVIGTLSSTTGSTCVWVDGTKREQCSTQCNDLSTKGEVKTFRLASC